MGPDSIMSTAIHYPETWSRACSDFWKKLAPPCVHLDCVLGKRKWRGIWPRLRHHRRTVRLQGARYCVEPCLERALADLLQRMSLAPLRPAAAHRVPLGLLLLSRQQLTAEQLRTALAAQREAGHGRIGEWLQSYGFAGEQQVTAALARQWSCPVLLRHSAAIRDAAPNPRAQIPHALLRSLAMIPLGYVTSSATLHLAFSEGIDHGVLLAIEHMTGCRTQACLAVPSWVREKLQSLPQRRGETEVVFDRVADAVETARIIRSYCVRMAATDLTLAACGRHVWVRLIRPPGPSLDLVLPELLPRSARDPAPRPMRAPPLLGGTGLKSASGLPIET